MTTELKRELNELRQRLEELTGKLTSDAPVAGEHALGNVAPSPTGAAVLQILRDWLDGLKRDIDDSRPRALVASFLAGVAVGRLLR